MNDIKVGDMVICVDIKKTHRIELNLTLNKSYLVHGIDYNSITVMSDKNEICNYYSTRFIKDIKYERKIKLQKLNQTL